MIFYVSSVIHILFVRCRNDAMRDLNEPAQQNGETTGSQDNTSQNADGNAATNAENSTQQQHQNGEFSILGLRLVSVIDPDWQCVRYYTVKTF